jgi:hypothetical protein
MEWKEGLWLSKKKTESKWDELQTKAQQMQKV